MIRVFAMPVDVHFSEAQRLEREAWIQEVLRASCTVRVESPCEGAEYLESSFDQALTAKGILELGASSQAREYDALAVLCMTDPFIDALREMLDIPVVGSAQASTFTAVMVAERFSVICSSASGIPVVGKAVARSGVDPQAFASIRAMDMTIAEMAERPSEVLRQLEKQSRQAIEHDGAQAIVLGCTEMGNGTAAKLSERLGIPVIDPNIAAASFAKMMVELRLTHSRLAYPRTPFTIPDRYATAEKPERV